jgi:cytochrome P450
MCAPEAAAGCILYQTIDIGQTPSISSGTPDAEQFDIERDWTRHLAFGNGIHYCLGAPLARVEAAVALNAMLDRYETIAPASRLGTRQCATNVVFGFTQLPLRL